ncbi:MAG: hypothetical protein WAO15_10015 [Mycobacterium sp.]
MDWRYYHGLAVRYYEALYLFNRLSAAKRQESGVVDGESRERARERLLFDRPTMGNEEVPLLYEVPEPPEPVHVDPREMSPGQVPLRMAGRTPKNFFPMFKAFLGVVLMGRAPEPEEVDRELNSNPSFARACGFTWPEERAGYRASDVPSLRKIEQFDQIMTEAGLWDQAKLAEVRRNIETGVIKPESTVVHDTTHYQAYSSFEVVEYRDEKGQAQKKSAARPTKRCGCKDRDGCPHPWVYGDEGAGTVVKSSGRMYWAHKASLLSLPGQGIALDAHAVTDAASHDRQTVVASLERLYAKQPMTKSWFDTLLDDGAADEEPLRKELREKFRLRLVCSTNARARKAVTAGLPHGVAQITPAGEPVCLAGHRFDYRGVRWETEVFLFGPPLAESGEARCAGCNRKPQCCPRAGTGRYLSLRFDRLPQINPDDPPLAKRFRAMLARRTSIERVIKILKCDLGGKQLSKRGNAAFQARLDKTLVAYHILLRE